MGLGRRLKFRGRDEWRTFLNRIKLGTFFCCMLMKKLNHSKATLGRSAEVLLCNIWLNAMWKIEKIKTVCITALHDMSVKTVEITVTYLQCMKWAAGILFRHMCSWCTRAADSLCGHKFLGTPALTDWGADKTYITDTVAETQSMNWPVVSLKTPWDD